MIHQERTLEIDARPEANRVVLSRFMSTDEFPPQVKSDQTPDGRLAYY